MTYYTFPGIEREAYAMPIEEFTCATQPAAAIEMERIARVVCQFFNVPRAMLELPTRKCEIVQARQITMYFCKALTKNSLAVIGAAIGGKDHATVLHACKTVNNLIYTDRRFAEQIKLIEKRLEM